MKTQALSHLLRVFYIFAAIQFVFDVVFVIFGFAGQADILLLPILWDVATLPLWLLALLFLLFKKKESLRQTVLDSVSDEQKQKLESSHLFGQDYEDVLIQRQGRFLTKILSPIFVILSILAILGLSLAVYQEYFVVNDEKIMAPIQGSVLLFRACVSYILAVYIIGLSVPIKDGGLATLGGLALYHCFQCVVLGVTTFINKELTPNVYAVLHTVLVLSFVLYGLEVLVRAVMRLYAVEKSSFPPQCSSLINFKIKEQIIDGAKQSFEYQFGYDFRSSVRDIANQAGFYLLCLLLISLAASSCFGTIQTGEVGFIEMFGKKQSEELSPGLYFKLPWPIAQVKKVEKDRVRRLSFGSKEIEAKTANWMGEDHEDKSMYLILDNKTDSRDLPFEAYAVDAVLYYKIKSAEQFLYQYRDPDTVIKHEAERLLVHELLKDKHADKLLTDRSRINKTLTSKLKQKFNELNLGIEVTNFSIPLVHPPQSTAEAFEAAISAHQIKMQKELEAMAKRSKLEADLVGIKAEKIFASYAEAALKKSEIYSDMIYLEKINPIIEKYKEIYLKRKTIDTYSEATKASRKYMILSKPSKEINTLNLEDVLEGDVLDRVIKVEEN